MFTRLTFNLSNAPIRHEVLQGKNYLVAPLAMITEGVHNGSGGPLLYKESEIKRAIPAWNMKPIVVYHPEEGGKGCSACDPLVLEKQQVGMVMNTKWAGGKLRAEAWIDEAQATKVDGRVIEALEQNKMMEVSTGLFTTNVGAGGKWGEKDYVAEATDHMPDHLALLPDQIGACSIADGAGLLQLNEAATGAGVDITRLMAREMDVMRRLVGNAMSNANVYAALNGGLRGRFKSASADPYACGPYIVDVYPDFFVFEKDGGNGVGMKLYRLGYTAGKEDVTIDEGTPEEVVRVTEYRTADKGKFVGNEARSKKGGSSMERKKIIDGLIANEATGWEEGDRAALDKMTDDQLTVANKAATPKKKKKADPDPDADEDEGEDAGDAPTGNGKVAKAKKKKDADAEDDDADMPTANGKGKKRVQTAAEYVANAPADIRELLNNGLAVAGTQKAAAIETIVANKGNRFSKEYLATKGLQELQGLAALCAAPADYTGGNSTNAPAMFFGGQATPAGAQPTANAAGTQEAGLELPVMNFERKAAK